jgi:hypothetical protein
MSRKTSTAALDTFRQRRLPNLRRVPRHPASEKPANRSHGRFAMRASYRLSGRVSHLPPASSTKQTKNQPSPDQPGGTDHAARHLSFWEQC